MKFTLSWLKEHLDTDASLEEITDTLTAIGLELESVEDRAKVFAPFKSAFVEKAEKHPDADKLKLCIVDTGEGRVQVVCGAPNARTGMKGVFAPEGSYIPGSDMVLKKGVIRGVESCGMLVSEREMGLSDDHEGIIELPEETPVGVPFAELFGLDDPVIDIAVTPNRADCAGIRGIARDLAAAGLGTLKPLDATPVQGKFPSPVTVDIRTPETNPQFIGRYIKGVKNGPSPDWLQQKLKAVGLRPISILVDITNYTTLAYGRPLHVFDADRLTGNIHSRLSKKGETLEALNDKSYELDEGMTVICDDSGVLGLGGIVGGVSTGCEEDTTNVYIECAYFDPLSIARTGRALQIESDARYRFERGVDPAFLPDAMEIATKLIMDLCGGEPGEVVVAGQEPEWKRTIEFDPSYVKKLAGMDVPPPEQKTILENLGFTVSGDKVWNVQPPSWRVDIEGKADLVEEVIRIYGFDKLPETPVKNPEAVAHTAETQNLARARKARATLGARGLEECVTWSFMPRDLAEQFGANDRQAIDRLTLVNPINAELNQMRPSALPNLIEAAGRNHDRGYPNAALFEVGPAFETAKIDGQELVAAGVRHGARGSRHWSGSEANRAVDVFDAKADALAVLESCGGNTDNVQISRDAPRWYHPGRSAVLKLGPNVLARFGEIHPAILEDMDVKGPVAGFEVFLGHIPEARKKSGAARAPLKLSAFQPVNRDFAFIVDEGVEAEALARAAKGADKQLVTAVTVFDIYAGKGMEEGKKSVALNVTLQPAQQTLTDAELEAVSRKIVDSVAAKTGAVLRG